MASEAVFAAFEDETHRILASQIIYEFTREEIEPRRRLPPRLELASVYGFCDDAAGFIAQENDIVEVTGFYRRTRSFPRSQSRRKQYNGRKMTLIIYPGSRSAVKNQLEIEQFPPFRIDYCLY